MMHSFPHIVCTTKFVSRNVGLIDSRIIKSIYQSLLVKMNKNNGRVIFTLFAYSTHSTDSTHRIQNLICSLQFKGSKKKSWYDFFKSGFCKRYPNRDWSCFTQKLMIPSYHRVEVERLKGKHTRVIMENGYKKKETTITNSDSAYVLEDDQK